MTGKIIKVGKNYQIKLEDRTILNTFHAQKGLIPMRWNCKYNTKSFIKSIIKDNFNIDIVQ